jgi:hypothetical protein
MKISRNTLILAIKALEAMRAIDKCLNLSILKKYDDAIDELNDILKSEYVYDTYELNIN